jgi:hypothetical protein
MTESAKQLVEIYARYFWKHCPDTDAYFDDIGWGADDIDDGLSDLDRWLDL